MKNTIYKIGIIIIIISIVSSGCLEQEKRKDTKFDGVYLESNVVELAYAFLDFHTKYNIEKEKNIVEKVEVKYRFHNIAGRDININVTVNFYDTNNTLLDSKYQKSINNLFKDYTETMLNTVAYDGKKVTKVDHVKIIALEI
jgi:hypothetical protein